MKSHKFTKCLLLAIAASGMQTNAQTALADSTESSPQPVIGITDPTTIKNLAAAAYVWSLPAEYTYRFSKYNELVTAPANTLKYFSDPALWNNAATNAGNPSALYIYGTFDLTLQDLVFTIPATDKTFSLFAFYDNFTNTIANPGTRTTPSSVATTYLLVGPNSEYADKKNVRLKGFNYKVIASDTYRAQLLARIGVNALAPASNPDSVSQVRENVMEMVTLNTLEQFQQNHNQSVFPATYEAPTPTPEQLTQAQQWQNDPSDAIKFFTQAGESLKENPLPTRDTGLSGTLLKKLPTYIIPQPNANNIYFAASSGQQSTLALFKPIGLTQKGFTIPSNWGDVQLQAFQQGFELGEQKIASLMSVPATAATNYWSYSNNGAGIYPNTNQGYDTRAIYTRSGGIANLPIDATYAQLRSNDGDTPLNGNNTYSITFKNPVANDTNLPAVGILPPLATDNNGNALGNWSLSIYQPDTSQAAAPFISQASVLNTAYSSATTPVISVNASTDTMTVAAPDDGSVLTASTPILFGTNASQYGLEPGIPYYIANNPTTDGTNLSIQVTKQWIQNLSSAGVPIQFSGKPGSIVDLTTGVDSLSYGSIKPVSQLGSAQITSQQLATNADGSYTLWLSPTLPNGVAPTNWIPTPSTEYLQSIYGTGQPLSTKIAPSLRIYMPTPGDQPPSILPCPASANPACPLSASYMIPPLVKVSTQ